MKNCEQIQALLIDFVDKTLDREKTREVRQHLESCKQCRDEADILVVLFGEMEKVENQMPDASLSQNFHAMLEAEKEKSGKVVKKQQPEHFNWFYSYFGQIAAAITILLTGMFIGSMLNGSGRHNTEVAEIKKEMYHMKEMLILSKLSQPVASERMIAASYLDDVSKPDEEVLKALIKTMNTDQNSNVRMAAMNALTKFKNESLVADALVESLALQTDPIIQISLINILVKMRDNRAVDQMKQIIDNNNTNQSVKKLAEEGILTLI